MTPEQMRERADEWHRSPELHRIIVAHRSTPGTARCELCDSTVAALPESVERQQQPLWHLICRECLGIITPGHLIRFGGRFRDSKTARKVLP